MGLHQRAAILRDHWDLPSLTHQTVFNYYQRLGVSFKRQQIVHYSKMNREREISDRQQTYCKEIVWKMMNEPGLEII